MAQLTPLELQDARRIGVQYGIGVVSCRALDAGSVNSNFRLEGEDGRWFFLRVYEEQAESGASAELSLVTELARLGVPTPAPLERPDGSRVVMHEGKPIGIYPWVDGEILCMDRVGDREAFRLGRALAGVHACTSSLSSVPAGRFGIDGIRRRLDSIERQTQAYADDVALIRRRLDDYASRSRPSLPGGLIHGDLFRDNVLFQRGEIVALIDFESASSGTFAYDLMVCVHAWCYADAYRPELVAALLSGYQSLRRLSEHERQALVVEGCLGALRFATTRITDFSMRTLSGGRPARDYRRFLERMRALESGAIDSIIEEAIA